MFLQCMFNFWNQNNFVITYCKMLTVSWSYKAIVTTPSWFPHIYKGPINYFISHSIFLISSEKFQWLRIYNGIFTLYYTPLNFKILLDVWHWVWCLFIYPICMMLKIHSNMHLKLAVSKDAPWKAWNIPQLVCWMMGSVCVIIT